MAATAKIISIGNSVGIILPKEVMAKMHLEKGDQVYFNETANGMELTPYDQNFAEEMEAARHVMRKNRDVLRRLAE
jgi:putative addiction module antidote